MARGGPSAGGKGGSGDDRGPGSDGRRPFKGLSPKGVRVRMMEPGEAPILSDILRASLAAEGLSRDIDRTAFVRWLLAHEVFVAEDKATRRPVGFAAARDFVDLYWLSALVVGEERRGRGIGSALLGAVAARAGWFFHRAVGHATRADTRDGQLFYQKRGFVTVPRETVPEVLLDRLDRETPDFAPTDGRVIAVKWL